METPPTPEYADDGRLYVNVSPTTYEAIREQILNHYEEVDEATIQDMGEEELDEEGNTVSYARAPEEQDLTPEQSRALFEQLQVNGDLIRDPNDTSRWTVRPKKEKAEETPPSQHKSEDKPNNKYVERVSRVTKEAVVHGYGWYVRQAVNIGRQAVDGMSQSPKKQSPEETKAAQEKRERDDLQAARTTKLRMVYTPQELAQMHDPVVEQRARRQGSPADEVQKFLKSREHMRHAAEIYLERLQAAKTSETANKGRHLTADELDAITDRELAETLDAVFGGRITDENRDDYKNDLLKTVHGLH
jgi:hypothetical protein